MQSTRSNSRDLTLGALEEIAVSARSGFGCMFSTSDEYEAALIRARRAEGRYLKPSPWPMVTFWGSALAIASVVLIASL